MVLTHMTRGSDRGIEMRRGEIELCISFKIYSFVPHAYKSFYFLELTRSGCIIKHYAKEDDKVAELF